MALTKATRHVIEQDIEFNTINGFEISLFAKPNAIPASGLSGKLDSSWGTGGRFWTVQAGGDMYKDTYDTNADGKVNFADVADSISGSAPNQVFVSNKDNKQVWANQSSVFLLKEEYDPNNSGSVLKAIESDKISGNPPANRIWGTDKAGNQNWLVIGSGDMMSANYDSNIDGIVDRADYADALFLPDRYTDRIYAIDQDGAQIWAPIAYADLMLKSRYDTKNTGEEVDLAYRARGLYLEDSASNSTLYGKDKNGNVNFYNLFSLYPSIMNRVEYDSDNDGVVDIANIANKLSTEITAGANSVYYKDIDGNVSFKDFIELANEQKVMLAGDYDLDGDKTVERANVANHVKGYEEINVDVLPQLYGLAMGHDDVGFYDLSTLGLQNISIFKNYQRDYNTAFEHEFIGTLDFFDIIGQIKSYRNETTNETVGYLYLNPNLKIYLSLYAISNETLISINNNALNVTKLDLRVCDGEITNSNLGQITSTRIEDTLNSLNSAIAPYIMIETGPNGKSLFSLNYEKISKMLIDYKRVEFVDVFE